MRGSIGPTSRGAPQDGARNVFGDLLRFGGERRARLFGLPLDFGIRLSDLCGGLLLGGFDHEAARFERGGALRFQPLITFSARLANRRFVLVEPHFVAAGGGGGRVGGGGGAGWWLVREGAAGGGEQPAPSEQEK